MAIEFKIELGGNFVGALQQSTHALGEAEKQTKKTTHEVEAFETELGKVKAGAVSLNFNALRDGGNFFKFDLAEGAALAGEAIKKVAEAVIDLGGEIIKAAADAEDLNLAVKLDVGEENAEGVDKLTESFKNSAFSPHVIKEALLPILEESGSAHKDQWNDLATAATDVATRRRTGVAGAKAALSALNEIELNPQRLRGSLKELGIKQLDFYADLGSLLGVSSKAAEAQVKAGKIQSQTLLSVALNQIAAREGGALGNATNEGAHTLGASIARLGAAKDELFERLAGSRGLKALQSGIDTFVETIEGPLGDSLINTIDQGFLTVFGDLSGPDGAKKLQGVVIDLTHDVQGMITGFQQAWPDIKAGASTVWEILKGIAKTVGVVVDGWRQIADLSRQWDSGRIQRDIVDTIKGEHGGIAGDAVNANSPQWKRDRAAAAMAAAQAAAGGVPAFADGGIVNGPTLALIGEAGPEAVIPLGRAFGSLPDSTAGGGGFGGASIAYSPTFQFSGSSREVEKQIEAFEQRHRIELSRFFDELAAANGG